MIKTAQDCAEKWTSGGRGTWCAGRLGGEGGNRGLHSSTSRLDVYSYTFLWDTLGGLVDNHGSG